MTNLSEAPTRREYAELILVLGVLAALSPFTIDAYLPALPSMSAELGGSLSAGQATVTGVLVGMGVGQLVLGPLSDAVGRRWPALIGIAVHVLVSLACLAAPTIEALIVLRFGHGLAGAATTVVSMAVVRDRFDGTRAAVLFSRLMLIVILAPVIAPVIGGALLQWLPWRGVFVFLAVTAAGIGVLTWRRLPETLPPERRSVRGAEAVLATYGVLLRDRVLLAMTVLSGLLFAALFVFISTSPFIYQQVYGLSEVEFAATFVLTAVCYGISTQLNPILLRRWGPAVILRGLQIAFVAMCLVLVVSVAAFGTLWSFVVPFSLAALTFGAANPNAQAIALQRHGERAGAAAALVGAGRAGIAGVLTPLVGLVGEASVLTTSIALLVLAVASLGALAIAGKALHRDDYR